MADNGAQVAAGNGGGAQVTTVNNVDMHALTIQPLNGAPAPSRGSDARPDILKRRGAQRRTRRRMPVA